MGHAAGTKRRSHDRFQLVFRHPDGDRTEHWDNNHDGEPHINGKLIVDGETFTIRGVDWILRREDVDGSPRFLCTLAVEPAEAK